MIKILRSICLISFVIFSFNVQAQTDVSGTVTSDDGEPLPGVNVVVEGTSKGAVTGVNGEYSISLSSGENTLVFSFIGFQTQTIEVGNRSVIDVTMVSDIKSLEEVIVIGYGTSSERNLTTAISTVDSEEIIKTPNSNAMQALQGKVAGVQITSNGAPGASPNVRVRGVGTYTDNDPGTNDGGPLYVVDGMFVDNIDFINPSDIKNISVLKDASAAAIYGVRAANGVVIVETKSGEYEQPVQIVYDGYYGVQVPQNVLKMANTEQFANYINGTGNASEIASINDAIARYGRSRVNPNLPVTNTDWYDEVMVDTAPIQSHSLTISGGSQKTKYSVGGSYFNQEGLIDHMPNDYERMNFRAKIDAIATDWLTVGGNVTISNATQYNADQAVWFQSYFAVPTLPVYDPLNTTAEPTAYGNARQIGYRSVQNPFFLMENNSDRNRTGKIIGNFYADFQIIPDKLSFKTSYNYFYQNIQARNVDLSYNDGSEAHNNGLTRISSTDYNQIWDNVLTYTDIFGDHGLTVTLGHSFRSEEYETNQSRATQMRLLTREESTWYIPGGSELSADNTFSDGTEVYGLSFFGRVAYDYKSKYLLYGTYRRDGTNRFGQLDYIEKWGNFFTVGAGWIVTEEDFFDVNGIDFLKLRAGWGQMGNENIGPAIGQVYYDQVTITVDDNLVTGVAPVTVYDIVEKWETTVETNLGITARFLDNRLTFEGDVYRRDTEDAVLGVLQPGTGQYPRRNAGEIRNQGFEIALGWSDQLGEDLSYNVSANFGALENEVLSIGGQEFLDAGNGEFRQRTVVGSSLKEYFGYEVLGVFQTEQDISSSGYSDDFIGAQSIVPGDLHFKDQNGDGQINSDDRVFLGSFIPTYTFGFNLGVNYKGFSLTAYIQGQGGNKILNRKRGEIVYTQDTNIDEDLASGFWTGPGTSNEYPSAAGYRKGYNNNQLSELWLEDGDYFRIQNVRLAYSFSNPQVLGVNLPQTTVSFTAERPLTVFDYNGFNPEVVDGVDRQTYPIPAIYTIGLNLKL